MVTGATGGFGTTICKSYARYGATVILLGKNIRLLEQLYDEIETSGGPTPAIYPMNLEGATERDYFELSENIGKEFKRLDGLVHCAALLGAPSPFEHSDTETWYKVLQVNLNAPYLLSKFCLPLLKKSDHASMIFLTDEKPGAYWDAYNVSKQAINGLMQNLAAEYHGRQLFINSVKPDPTKTQLQIRAFPALDKNKSLPTPEIYQSLFLYLMSNENQKSGVCYQI